jgi:serine/threonine protein kinase/tetratricopeptide (TPR) repeat protein
VQRPAQESQSGVDPNGSSALPRTIKTTPGPSGAVGPPAPPESAPVWPAPPGYEILGVLGEGGMGVVYRARQIAADRLVALKMIRGGTASPEDLARFHTEAKALAKLQHPNIVQIYEVGTFHGQPYFSLEYVEGGSLDHQLKEETCAPRQSAEIVRTIAQAIHAAHQRGVIHRDLKPANVLVGADWLVKVTDFGLAKRLDDDSGQTRSGQIMGTPSYMAPEQAVGDLNAIGRGTDVWALGAILYECLTGRPPFKGPNVWETLQQVCGEDPVPPSRLSPKCPPDLETICLKCLEKDRTRRYREAEEVAEELRCFLADESIRARPTPLWERSVKWARRRPLQAVLAGAILFAILATISGAVLFGLNQTLTATVSKQQATMLKHQLANREIIDRLFNQGKDAENRGQLALARDAGEEAAREFETARRKFAGALDVIEGEPEAHEEELFQEIAEARDRVSRHLRDLAVRQSLRAKSRQFLENDRDQILFHETNVTGRDQVANQEQIRRLAPVALARLNLGMETPALEAAQSLKPYESELQSPELAQQLAAGCCEVLLVWAEAEAAAPPGPAAPGREVRAQQALRLLALADALGQAYGLRTPQALAVRKARYLAQAGDEGEAAAERARASQLKPTTAQDLFLTALDAYRRKEITRAAKDCQKALAQSEHFWARYLLALCQMRMTEWGEARLNLTVCVTRRKDLLWPRLLRASAAAEQKQFEDAEVDFAQALKQAKEPFDRYVVLTNRSAMYIRQGRWRDGRADLTEATRLQPEAYQAYLNLAQVHKALKDLDAARTTMDQALTRAPGNAGLYHTRAEIQLERGDLAAARQDFEEAIAREPEGQRSERLASDHVQLGHLRHRAKEYKEALGAGEAALATWPDYPPAHLLRAKSYLALGQHAEAGRELDHYLRANGKPTADVFKARGVIHSERGDDARALVAFSQALDLKEEADTFSYRGWAHLRLDSPRAALPDFEAALKLDGANPDALYGRGHAQVLLGRVPEAIRDAETALQHARAAGTEPHRAARLLLNAACIYARAAGKLLEQVRSVAGEEKAYRYEERAVDLLRSAVMQVPEKERQGFWQKNVRNEPALRSLQLRTDMRVLANRYGR